MSLCAWSRESQRPAHQNLGMKFLTQPVSDFLQILVLLAIAPLAFGQQGTIAGTVVDSSGASVAHAKVKLSLDDGGPGQETQSADDGDFTFANVSKGPFHISFTAAGFAVETIAGELHDGEALKLPRTTLVLATITTEVNVTQTQAEIAELQIKEAETQRLIGLVPNYFVNYNRDAVPLNSKQKFELTWKTFLDPSAFVINGIIAGAWQAQNTYKGFGQGAQGYAKRYGASYADFGTSLVIEKVAARASSTPSAVLSSARATTEKPSSAIPVSSAELPPASSPTTTTQPLTVTPTHKSCRTQPSASESMHSPTSFRSSLRAE
jgi:hypothetical protein